MQWPRIAPYSARASRPRLAPREPFPKRFARLLRRVMLCFVLGVVATGGFFAWRHVQRFIFESDFFRIDPARIRITGASEPLESEARRRILTALPARGNNLCRLDSRELSRRLANLPRARAVTIRKQYPQGLSVAFDERQPLMIANLDRPWLIDGDGIVLDGIAPARIRELGLPVLTGVRAPSCRPGDRLDQPRLKDVLEDVLFWTHKEAKSKGIVIEYKDCAAGVPVLWADPNQLKQVLLNLVINAIHAMERGGRITVGMCGPFPPREWPGEVSRARFCVEDSGPGIPETVLPRIFDPFFTTRSDGTGLGLAVVKKIAVQHGADIMVRNLDGGGARFEFSWPIAGGESAAGVEPSIPPCEGKALNG